MGCSSSKSETTPKPKIEDSGSTTSIIKISNDEMEKAYTTVEDDDDVNPGELEIFRKKSKQFLKGSVESIVKKDIFIIKKESQLQDIAKKLKIVGNLCDVLENKTKQSRMEQYQMQVVDWLCEIKLDELCCRTISNFSKYREKHPDVFEDGSVVIEIVNSCLTVLWSYCEISQTFAVKIARKKDVLEFVKNMLQENHKNMNDKIGTEETTNEVNESTLSYQDPDGDENAEDDGDERSTDVEETVEYNEETDDYEDVEDYEQIEGDEDIEEDEQVEDNEDFEDDEHSEGDEDFENDKQVEGNEDFEDDGQVEEDENVEDEEQVEGDEEVESDENDDTEASCYDKMIKNCQLLLYHISLYEDNVARLRNLKLLPVLSPYMSSEQSDLIALVTVANIVNEKECKIINKECVKSLLQILENCLNSNTGKEGGWSAYQCGLAVRRLARNDQNHKLLLENNVLPLIVKLASDGKSEEQLEGATALRYLAFNKKAKKKIVNDQTLGVVETLKELCKLDNDKIKEESYGALWTLRSDLEKSPVKEYRNIAKDLEKSKSCKAASDGTHIMISYQWDDQELVKDVKKRLTKAGYKVWLDIEEMKGSTLDAMSSAVERSKVVLVFMSRKYKDSRNCRSEAEYAHQTEKSILFVKTKRGYKADGWLGMLLATKLYYEFSEKHPFKETINKLLDAIKTEYSK
ncbi:uncharacterized protein LOC128547449 [Mercenaria mercenaria]|uniref:uncharacterized protein LOC128547449 n=1 Tax=Mercenaria mercenaria TaxID=6596 RepID=UPI00234EE364|nr:uncharacterized protein LOC128547449 [Mercenaria mercenaria]